MRKITYRPVYNRKNQLTSQNTALLQIEAYLDKKKIYLSTHIYLEPEQWDAEAQVIKSHVHANELNFKWREFILELEQKELELWKNGYEVTLNMLKEEFLTKTPRSFAQFVKEEIEAAQQKKSTKQNRFTTYLLLTRFRSGLTFKDITPKLIYDFERFLYENGLHTNTVAKHMRHLRSFVNAAIDRGYINSNQYAFQRYRIKTKESKHTFLLPEELKRLEELSPTLRRKGLKRSLDAFLFCCYTGLRYSDFRSLSDKNVVLTGGQPWIVFKTIKTGTEVKLPLDLLFGGKAWKMLKKRSGSLDEFFHVKSNSSINKDLIKIGKLAGIEKHFSFHSARHTNATLLLYKGVNITTVQKLLGHRNLATTQIYSEVMESTLIKDLKKCSGK